MKHGYGLKLTGTCYRPYRRFTPMRECTAYITFDNTELNMANTDLTQAANLARVARTKFDNTIVGLPYNCTTVQGETNFPSYYFDKADIASWGVRGVGCNEDFSSCTMRFRGPRLRNNLVVIPLKKHTTSPLKQGRLNYDFLNSTPEDTHSIMVDPLEFSGVYPFSPDDPTTIKKPAGWMYSNTNVAEPYFTELNYEGGESAIDRSTASSKQLNFMPFLNPMRVYDLNEVQIGQFDGLVFVLFFGEMAFKLPFVDLPEYEGLLKDFTEARDNDNPPYMKAAWQYFGLELNIFLAGSGVPSPRIGRQRFMLPNRVGVLGIPNDPGGNYFSLFFKQPHLESIDMTMNFAVKPSQVLEDEEPILPTKIPFSNMNIMVGA